MIAVIADDMTGAAELAGAGFARGLPAEVQTEFDPGSGADLLVVDTDSRPLPGDGAARRVADSARKIMRARPEWVFKKVDSVLRGNVLAEVTALRAALGRARALLVPANPSLGRVVRGGLYFVNGRPLHETDFAADPEHPARTSNVLELLGAGGRDDVRVGRAGQELPETGIIIGEAAEPADLAKWAQQVDEGTLPAGAAEFFAAVLDAKGPSPTQATAAEGESGRSETALFVCGSAAAWDRSVGEEAGAHGLAVLPMPPGAFCLEPAPEPIHEWARDTVAAINSCGAAMVAIGGQPSEEPGLARALLTRLVTLVELVLAARAVDRLFVEGGGTASALVRHMKWQRLAVCGQYAPGVVAMRPAARAAPVLTIKPGSYPWPVTAWQRGLRDAH